VSAASQLEIRLHAFVPLSRANGPGPRSVLWLQGCTLACPECFNPETHDRDGGRSATVDAVVSRIRALEPQLEGVTVSGGEPIQQAEALGELCRRIRATTSLSILVFSGYTLQAIERTASGPDVLAHIDVLVAGRYLHETRLGSGLLGSSNQTAHLLTDRYTREEVASTPEIEIQIGPSGDVLVTGMSGGAGLIDYSL